MKKSSEGSEIKNAWVGEGLHYVPHSKVQCTGLYFAISYVASCIMPLQYLIRTLTKISRLEFA